MIGVSVDTLNNYKKLTELIPELEDLVDTGILAPTTALGDDATIIEVMQWMLDIQLGRRNLSPIQRIAVAEKYRPIYERQAKERQATSTGCATPQLTPNLVEAEKVRNRSNNETNAKLAQVAGVGKETYRMGAKVLNSNNEDVKKRVLSGETFISAGYKELQNENKKVQSSNNSNGEKVISTYTDKELVKNML